MSTCNCPKQDGYANCCRAKSLEEMIENRNSWITTLEEQLAAKDARITELEAYHAERIGNLEKEVRWQRDSVVLVKSELESAQNLAERYSSVLKGIVAAPFRMDAFEYWRKQAQIELFHEPRDTGKTCCKHGVSLEKTCVVCAEL